MGHDPSPYETAESLLRGWGLTDSPAEYGDGIHGWRCEHPDRYGDCDCFERSAADVVRLMASTLESASRSLRTCGDHHPACLRCQDGDSLWRRAQQMRDALPPELASVSDPQRKVGE